MTPTVKAEPPRGAARRLALHVLLPLALGGLLLVAAMAATAVVVARASS